MVVDPWRLDVHMYEVPRKAQAEQRIRDAVGKFWRSVDAGEQPRADYTRDGSLLALIWPRESPGRVLDLRADNRMPELLAERERLKGIIKEANEKGEAIQAEIAEKLQDAEAAICAGWRLTYKQQTRKAYSVKESAFRVLRASRDASTFGASHG
jgi:hypothetical protein